MTKTLVPNIDKFLKSKPSGEYHLNTNFNGYWVKLHYGMVVDCAPILRDFLRCGFKYLLRAVEKKEGAFQLLLIER